MRRSRLTILMVGSLPLAEPWNGADKALARTLVLADEANRYIIQTGAHDDWPDHVEAIREPHPPAMPGWRSQLSAAAFLVRHSRRADVIHVVASVRHPNRLVIWLVRWWAGLAQRPIVHSMPAMAGSAIERNSIIGRVTVVFSRHTAERLESLGIPGVMELFPPVEIEDQPAPAGIASLRAELALGPRPILYAAHLDPDSGMAEAIEALARLPAALHDVTLVLAVRWRTGQNPDEAIDQLRAVADRAGVADRVRWLRQVDDMPQLIAACRLTALVARQLNGKMDLPLVLLESLAMGRPIIVSDEPPLSEALLGGGFAVPFGDAEALAAAFTALLDDPDLNRRMATAGRRRVRELADPRRAAEAYGLVYDRALPEGRKICA
jgi:glycosyltransferase involved in cell wall biosynthesis